MHFGNVLQPLIEHFERAPNQPVPRHIRARLLEAAQRAEAGESLSSCLGVGAEPLRDSAIFTAAALLGGTPWTAATRVAAALTEHERKRAAWAMSGRSPAPSELASALDAILSAKRPVRTPEGLYAVLTRCAC